MRKKLLSLAMATVLGITTVTAASAVMTQDVHAEETTEKKTKVFRMTEVSYLIPYTGQETNIDDILEIYDGETGKVLIKDTDYTLTYKDNIEIGTATVYVDGIGEYEGEHAVTTYNICKFNNKNKADNVVMPEPWYIVIYTGEETNIDDQLILMDGETGKVLVKDTDYTLTYKDNIEIGTATVYITGIGEYEGYTNEVQYSIVKRTEEHAKVTLTSYNATLYKSQQMKLSAKVDGVMSDDVEWKSSNEKVAKVSADGTVTAVAKGKAVITATYNKGDKAVTASCRVSVKNYSTKMYSKVKKIRTKDKYTFDNELITSYSQMKKLINKYSKVNYDASVMKKLKKYDKNYFKNKALCISTVNQQENETVSVGSVKKIMKANGKYTIKVSLNSKHISDAAVKKDKAAYNMVVEISKTVAGLSDKVVVK